MGPAWLVYGAVPPNFALAGVLGVPGRADPAHRGAAGPGRGGRAGALVDPPRARPAAGRPGGHGRPGGRAGRLRVWAHHEVGDFWAPLRVQLQSTHHGGLSDPFVTLSTMRGLFHHHVGTALHVPWVMRGPGPAGGLLAPLPASYTVFAAAVLAVAVAGSNLDSFERYALSAFPLTIAAALLCGEPGVERVVLVLLPAVLAGYALLAFLNIRSPERIPGPYGDEPVSCCQ